MQARPIPTRFRTAGVVSLLLALLTAPGAVLPAAAGSCPAGYTTTYVSAETVCEGAITASGAWTVPVGVTTVDVTVVGGGGGGAGGVEIAGKPFMGGAGGAGGTVTVRTGVVVSDSVTVLIGAGGAAGSETATGSPLTADSGTAGGSSAFGGITAAGGDGGQGSSLALATNGYGGDSGSDLETTVATTAGGRSSNFLYACGVNLCGSGQGGGGAGAGTDGLDAYYTGGQPGSGNGGSGIKPDTGLFAGGTAYFGGGGGGGNSGMAQWTSSGGAGGGGRGGISDGTADGIAGGPNTGGGGGGAGGGGWTAAVGKPGAGGSGVVVVRFVAPSGTAPVWSTDAVLETATAGVAHSATLVAAGTPSPSYAMAAGSALPPGMTLSASGALTDTPTTPGVYAFTVSASNAVGSVDRTFSIAIRPATPPAPFVAAGDGTATLSWPEIPSAQTYRISDGNGHVCTATAPTTTCTVEGLTNGTPYQFTLSVTVNGVTSLLSPYATVTPIAAASLGSGAAQEGGTPIVITIAPETPTGGSGLLVTGPDWTMTLTGLDGSGNPLPLATGGTLTLDQTRNAAVSGTGFMPDSLVYLYLYSTPTFLGTVATNGVGSFDGNVPVPSNVELGNHVLQANGFAPSGATRSLSLPVVLAAETSISYTGSTLLVTTSVSTNATLSAQTAPALSGCSVTFTLDNGQGGTQPGPFTATTGVDGSASLTQPIPIGAYSVVVSVGGGCLATPDDTGALIVATPGDAAYGGGWYQYPGNSPRANFGFVVRVQPRTMPTVYRGELLWSLKERWRFKGKLTTYYTVTTSGSLTGYATGVGSLFKWQAGSTREPGRWRAVTDGATVRISFLPTITGKKGNSPGTFGIQFGNLPSGVSGLPTADRQTLKGGAIKAS